MLILILMHPLSVAQVEALLGIKAQWVILLTMGLMLKDYLLLKEWKSRRKCSSNESKLLLFQKVLSAYKTIPTTATSTAVSSVSLQ
jgi:hypothetical protein